MLLAAHEIVRQFDVEPVLNRVSFEIREGDRIGLVGPNGAGKTTLIRILAGLDDADSGRLESPAGTTTALLKQQPEFPPGRTLLQEAQDGLKHIFALQQESADLSQQLSSTTDAAALDRLHKRFDHVQHQLLHLGGYSVDHLVDRVLSGLGFSPDDYHRPLNEMSGGQQNRALLARLLLESPDVMLLDEPTNHLDIAASEWLEKFLVDCDSTVVVVSHDRYFLDRVATRILELHRGSVADYPGNFSKYWSLREERREATEKTREKQQEFIAKTEEYIRKNNYGQNATRAKDREKKLARVELVEAVANISGPNIAFAESTRTGDWVLDADDLCCGYDRPLVEHFSLQVPRGARLGVLGPNGAGKTTLLKTLIGELRPLSGKVRVGANVKIGYFDQQLASVNPDVDAMEAIRPPDVAKFPDGQLRDILARFGVKGELAMQRVGAMSGGERTKVALAKLFTHAPNVLVLDEPTNHLDLWSRDALEQALAQFTGTLLFVSHDRYFLDRVATNVVAVDPGRWKHHHGNYSDLVAFERAVSMERESTTSKVATKSAAPSDAAKSPTKEKRKRKFPFRKVVDIEIDIAATEAAIASGESDMVDPAVLRDHQRLKVVMKTVDDARTKLTALYEHWEEAVELN